MKSRFWKVLAKLSIVVLQSSSESPITKLSSTAPFPLNLSISACNAVCAVMFDLNSRGEGIEKGGSQI